MSRMIKDVNKIIKYTIHVCMYVCIHTGTHRVPVPGTTVLYNVHNSLKKALNFLCTSTSKCTFQKLCNMSLCTFASSPCLLLCYTLTPVSHISQIVQPKINLLHQSFSTLISTMVTFFMHFFFKFISNIRNVFCQ